MKGLSLSGASTKIPLLAGAATILCNNLDYKPDYIVGTSAGSILAVPLALGLYAQVEDFVLGFNLDDIFDIKPVNSKGGITLRAILRAITGKESLGRQNQLIKTMKKLITPEVWGYYKDACTVECYAGIVEFKTGKIEYVRLKDLSYNQYFSVILASTSIPVFVESVKMNDGYYYDGGVRDHIGSHWLMENFDLDENVSIYSRPEDYDITDLNWTPGNIYQVLERTIAIMNIEVSKNDELKEDKIAAEKGIKNTKIFPPHVLSSSTYQADPELLQAWFEIGEKTARDTYSI